MPDYRNYDDEQLDALFRSRGGQIDHPAIVAEHQRRQNIRASEVAQNRHKESQSLGQKTLFWARVGGIAAGISIGGGLLPDRRFFKLFPSHTIQQSPTA